MLDKRVCGFKSDLIVDAVVGENSYVVLQDLIYYSSIYQFYFVVPPGTQTNFASVPKIMKSIVDDNDWYIRSPSVLHDYLYSKAGGKKYPSMTRLDCDIIMKEAMQCMGAPKDRVFLVYYALRLFGWLFYRGS